MEVAAVNNGDLVVALQVQRRLEAAKAAANDHDSVHAAPLYAVDLRA